MKILFLAGRHAYGDSSRGEGYEYANMLPALRALGHDVVHFESFDRTAYRGFAEMNRAFLEAVARERPDLVFCVLMGYELWTETLDHVAGDARTLLFNWGTDDSWKYDQFSRFIAPHVHCYGTTSCAAHARATADGQRNWLLTQWAAADAALAAPRPARDCGHRVTFVGAAYGNRRAWIQALARRGIHVECFGHGWPNGPTTVHGMNRIIGDSVITLNFGDSGLHLRGLRPYRSRQIKARVFEVPGAGGFLLTQPADDLDRHFRIGEELVTFDDERQLADAITRFLDDPDARDAIALAGHERVRRDHTWTRRLADLLASLPGVPGPTAAIGAGTASSSGDPEAAHAVGPLLGALGDALRWPLRVALGPRRGPRAARRLLFELSWRLAGAATYSARGWPGRLFYRES